MPRSLRASDCVLAQTPQQLTLGRAQQAKTHMKIGLYFDLRNPPGWRQEPARLYAFTLEMCEEAERLGADAIWVTEHHLFEDGYLPQPLTMAAAIAARTRRVRIGTAVMLAPLHSAASIAEQSAVVDLLSDGRFELGLGSGYRIPEFELFGADISKRFATTNARVRELRQLWAEGRLTPSPKQSRIPIWLGYSGPKNARRAGQLGEGLLAVMPELLEPYRQGLIDAGHDPSSARMAGVLHGWFTEDPEGDWPTVSKHVGYWLNSYRRYMVEGTGTPNPQPVDPEQLRSDGLSGGVRASLSGGSLLYTTPQQAAPLIKTYVSGLPVEHLFFWASFAGMPEAMVAHNVQRICTRLAPLLRQAR